MVTSWIVWKEGGNAPTYMHPSKSAAEAEADRLVRGLGGRFFVAQVVSCCTRSEVLWERPEPREIPDPPF